MQYTSLEAEPRLRFAGQSPGPGPGATYGLGQAELRKALAEAQKAQQAATQRADKLQVELERAKSQLQSAKDTSQASLAEARELNARKLADVSERANASVAKADAKAADAAAKARNAIATAKQDFDSRLYQEQTKRATFEHDMRDLAFRKDTADTLARQKLEDDYNGTLRKLQQENDKLAARLLITETNAKLLNDTLNVIMPIAKAKDLPAGTTPAVVTAVTRAELAEAKAAQTAELLHKAEHELTDTKAQIEQLSRAASGHTAAIVEARRAKELAETNLRDANASLAQARQRYEDLEARTAEVLRDDEQLRAAGTEDRERAQKTISDLTAAKDARIHELEQALNLEKQKGQTASDEAAAVAERLRKASTEIGTLRAELGATQTRLDKATADARAAVLADVTAARSELEATEHELAEVKENRNRLEGQLTQLRETYTASTAKIAELQPSLADATRRALAAEQAAVQLRQQLEDGAALLVQARQTAAEHERLRQELAAERERADAAVASRAELARTIDSAETTAVSKLAEMTAAAGAALSKAALALPDVDATDDYEYLFKHALWTKKQMRLRQVVLQAPSDASADYKALVGM